MRPPQTRIQPKEDLEMTETIKARVLLVDDEEEFLTTLASRLEIRGMNVVTVTRGEQAVTTVDAQAFDLVVIDLSMPGIDGLETLKRIKARQPDTEIIILTGQGSIRAGIEAMKLGAEDFLQKPVNIAELVEKISEAKDKRLHILQEKSVKEIEKILNTRSW
jgi:DNA-binding NtrC family response regulator